MCNPIQLTLTTLTLLLSGGSYRGGEFRAGKKKSRIHENLGNKDIYSLHAELGLSDVFPINPLYYVM